MSAARGLKPDFASEHIARQLTRSATSVAANYAEACEAESRQDFVHKIRLCLKELRECETWLRLASGTAAHPGLAPLAAECDELLGIFVASLRTARNRRMAE